MRAGINHGSMPTQAFPDLSTRLAKPYVYTRAMLVYVLASSDMLLSHTKRMFWCKLKNE